jgi:hypothetical protein
MIWVDTSVWVDYFNGYKTTETIIIDQILGFKEIVLGDIITVEVLQGFREEMAAIMPALPPPTTAKSPWATTGTCAVSKEMNFCR